MICLIVLKSTDFVKTVSVTNSSAALNSCIAFKTPVGAFQGVNDWTKSMAESKKGKIKIVSY